MASLSSLPPEIFNAVLDGLHGRDVTNLRLVGRRISALSNHQFGLKCLPDLSFIWSPYSLQGLLDLSAHPLGRYIRRLTFATHFVYAEKFTDDPEELQQLKHKTMFEQWDERLKVVVQALDNLKRQGAQPTLGVYDILVPWIPLDHDDEDSDHNNNNSDKDTVPQRKGYGYERFYGKIEQGVNPQASNVHAVQYVLKAAQQANLPIRGFQAHLDDQLRHPVNITDEFQILKEQHLCPQPGHLDPNFGRFVITSGWKLWETAPTLRFQSSIDTKRQAYEFFTIPPKHDPMLRQISVKFGTVPQRGQTTLDGALMITSLRMHNCLREVRLAYCSTTVNFLTTFLRAQSDTLRILYLEHVHLEVAEHGDAVADEANQTGLDLLLALRNDLQLEYLRIMRCCSLYERSRLIGGHDDTWIGRDEIQEGLQIYIKREEDDEHSVDSSWSSEDEGEWISVHHSENEEEEEEEEDELVAHFLAGRNDEESTEQPDVEEGNIAQKDTVPTYRKPHQQRNLRKRYALVSLPTHQEKNTSESAVW
ncbi:hypothetical protein E4T43_05499 [Aureobasidium subglaciale]|nr:hypothetical protein E4T43_05499 [Aureobasidium subglaciale]